MTSELPFERAGRRFPVVLKIEEPLGEGIEIGKVIGRKHLALDNREVDLDLIEPPGVHHVLFGNSAAPPDGWSSWSSHLHVNLSVDNGTSIAGIATAKANFSAFRAGIELSLDNRVAGPQVA